jgi:hypothetical protein
LCPAPHKVVALSGTSEKIHKRKPELPVPEIDRQIEMIHAYQERLRNLAVVDATGEIEFTFREILENICAGSNYDIT